MNIFYLDKCPVKAAQVQYNKHVVKMILESAQMLCTAHHELLHEPDVPYKPAHVNHPSTIWVRTDNYNYHWLYDHMLALGDEYTKRYGREHATITKLNKVLMYPPKNIPYKKFKQPPQAMPDECKNESSIIAYRTYYNLYKQHFAKWTNRKMPAFFKNYVVREN